MPLFSRGDISFLYDIPAIDTKFEEAKLMGPASHKGVDRYRKGDYDDPIWLCGDFRYEH